MMFLVDPDCALLERPDILSEDPDLDTAGPHASGGGHDDDVPLASLGRSQRHNLPVRLPLGDEETVAAVDEHAHQVLGADAEVLPPDGHLGAGRTLAGRDAADHWGRAHDQSAM